MLDPKRDDCGDILQLIEALRRGDPGAFEVFGKNFGGQMRAIAERLFSSACAPSRSSAS